VPSYAIIVREYFPAKEAGTARHHFDDEPVGHGVGRLVAGYIFDLAARTRCILQRLGWNAVNGTIVLWLLFRRQGASPMREREDGSSSLGSLQQEEALSLMRLQFLHFACPFRLANRILSARARI